METFAQLNAGFLILTFLLLFAFSWILTIAVIWKVFAFFRDVHDMRESLHWIAHCTKSDRQIEPVRPVQVANSAFGR